MGRIAADRRWKCKLCSGVTLEPDLLTAPSPFCDTYQLTGCPGCKQCDEGFELLCDEPGCNRDASCGWPTGNEADAWGGYRQTCYKHRETSNAQLGGLGTKERTEHGSADEQ